MAFLHRLLALHALRLASLSHALALVPDSSSATTRDSTQLQDLSLALQTAGDLTSDMASKLPNWYSSKEGLTGESPAVFGGGGMALRQAGESLLLPDSNLVRVQHCAGDLAHAACQLEPVGLNEDLDMACGCLENMIFNKDPIYKEQAGLALQRSARAFQDYGVLLCNEDKASTEQDSAGRILSRAGQQLDMAGGILISLPWSLFDEDVR